MTRIRPWDEETAAADLFVELNDGTWELVDGVDAPDSTYDIKVTLSDARTVALEVTQDTTQAIRRQYAIEGRLDWTSDLLDAWWEVSVVEPCDVQAIHREVFDLIVEFSSTGETSVVIGRSTPPSELVDRLRSLGVRLLHRVADETPGRVNLSPASQVGSTAPSVLVEIAEDHANRSDNARKLDLADTDERHLWIWVTMDRGAQIAALIGDFAPTESPLVPEHVDAIWIATAYHPATIWSWSRDEGWQRHPVGPDESDG